MHLLGWDPTPLHELACRTAAGAGAGAVDARIVVTRATTGDLPTALDALLVASDLQAREAPRPYGTPPRLIGEAVAEELALLAELGGPSWPDLSRTGVLLCGDLYAAPGADERGASGDVRTVWAAFVGAGFRWVCGVAGNHDRFGDSAAAEAEFAARPGVHLIDDGVSVTLDGLRVAGIGGILGNPGKPRRRSEADWSRALSRAAAAAPDVLVLHEGPDDPTAGLRGSPFVRTALAALPEQIGRRLLVLCGHCHWPSPLQGGGDRGGGAQVFNADGRVVLVTRPGTGS